ncbi:major facilitator superfamily transporter [Colletotrichum higginsianum IMI 349063]|uniref:Major facilitator superfamily transporter n=2 Tax=Colletotrichum higginsianum (strain IMI 349063) TaxID=759273 RepID=A0A1B7YVF0_COLHI|nr:major facilitator superfamily transporter [Colletotrichum higginsianum IMI 349063]OBR16019.1 major facilitator superfamily transporter [Colletotrichum higginsianum IMI 349063]
MDSPTDDKMVCDTPTDRSVAASEDKPEWDHQQEQKAKRKIDLTVLPLLVLGLLMFQLDRMNLASALTAGFAKDIDVSQDTINLGNQLMFMGTVVLEIPCNLLLQWVRSRHVLSSTNRHPPPTHTHTYTQLYIVTPNEDSEQHLRLTTHTRQFGPRKWISLQVLLFGLVATLQVLVKNRAGFLAIRLMLGLAEAGYIPGSMYTLSTWYTKRELAKRIAIFMFGQFGGNALSPLLATGILKLAGKGGLKGWQWLFLLEGLATLGVALMLIFLLPGSPDTPKPLGSPGIVRFTTDQREILQKRIHADEPGSRHGVHGIEIPWALVWKTVKHYKRWPHYVSTFCVFSTWSPLTTYTPSIIMALGFDRISANALAAVGASLAMAVVFAFATLSDRTNKRGMAVILGHVCYLTILVVARSIHPHVGKWSRWGLWTMINAFAVCYHPAHNTWLQVNCRDPGERSIGIAMWVMSAISGLMVGSQYFRGDDLPFYDKGLLTMIIMVSVGMAFALLQEAVYFVHNRRVAQGKHTSKDGSEPYVYVF